MLPGIDGFTVARNARAEGVQTPILMLTARDAVEDRVTGLDCGADDYLAKPFVEGELIARVRAILRRADRPLVTVIEVGKLRIDVGARTRHATKGNAIDFGATEFRLLELLARNAGIALSRTQILERIWDYDFDGSSNIVDVYVSQLRRKLRKHGANGIIETVWGIGYRLTRDRSHRGAITSPIFVCVLVALSLGAYAFMAREYASLMGPALGTPEGDGRPCIGDAARRC